MTQVMPLMTQFGGTTDRFLGPMKAATRDEVRWGRKATSGCCRDFSVRHTTMRWSSTEAAPQ